MSSWKEYAHDGAWLPEGKTCADCQHLATCVAMFGGVAEATACDWSPSRFAPRKGASS